MGTLAVWLIATVAPAQETGPVVKRIVWPTPNTAFMEGLPLEDFIQPTASGRIESGLFGCVRNDGRRFHEGLDLKSIQRDRRGESTDPIFAVAQGDVVYVNSVPGHSSYGRYVVIEHTGFSVPVYTLYAHLRSINPAVRPGVRLQAGAPLGIMGRSAGGYVIPRERAHLHFEIGLRLSDDFQRYFDRQDFGSPNHHGNYSGLNLMGFDPLMFYSLLREGGFSGFATMIRGLPTAFSLEVRTTRVPDFVRRYPALLTSPLPPDGVAGWRIEFTWYGLPKQWTPLGADAVFSGEPGQATLLEYHPDRFEGSCRGTIIERNGRTEMGDFLRTRLAILFDSP